MCTMYWPDGEGSECVKQFGDYAITLMKKDIQQDYIETTLQLRDMEVNSGVKFRHHKPIFLWFYFRLKIFRGPLNFFFEFST